MTPLARTGPGPAGRLGALLLAAGCLLLAVASLTEVARNRVALAVVLPVGTPCLLAALALSVGAAAAALVAAVRALRRPAGEPGPHLPWRVAFCVVLAAVAVHVALAQPWRGILARATLAVAAGAIALLLLLGWRLVRRVPRRVLAAADLAACALAVALVAAELVLSLLASTSSSPLFARGHEPLGDFANRFRLDPLKSTPDFPVNAAGHFDTAFHARRPGAPLAVCIGDSFSTSVVPHAFHFTTVAERVLGRGAIHNMGVAGIGLAFYDHLLRNEALPLDPDVIVVDIFVGNDLVEAPDRRRAGWLQRCTDGERLMTVLVARRLLRLAGAEQRDARPLDAGGAGRGSAEDARAHSLQELEQLYPWLADPLREVPGYGPVAYEELELERALDVCRRDAPPDWDMIHERVAAMRAACGDIPFAVMLIPDEFQVEDAVWDGVRASAGGADLDRDLPQRELLAWLALQGIPTLDLLPALRAVPPLADGRRHLYHLRDAHFNARGNDLAGRELATFLERWWR